MGICRFRSSCASGTRGGNGELAPISYVVPSKNSLDGTAHEERQQLGNPAEKIGACRLFRVWDLGYPRTVQRPDGKIVTMYYFNDASSKERYIAATIWRPGRPREQ